MKMEIKSFETPAVDLSRPSLPALVWVLRHREIWPPRFKWDYTDCYSCAMGLAWRLWRKTVAWPGFMQTGRAIGISDHEATRVFCHLHVFENTEKIMVTPEMVARNLEKCTVQ